jgi:hypothetical protein
VALAGWAWSGGRAEAGPGGGGEQLHVGVGKDPVIAECAVEQVGGDDRHALGVQAATLDVGAVDAQQGVDAGAEQPANRLRLPADRPQGAIQRIVVVPDQPVGALVDAAGPLL